MLKNNLKGNSEMKNVFLLKDKNNIENYEEPSTKLESQEVNFLQKKTKQIDSIQTFLNNYFERAKNTKLLTDGEVDFNNKYINSSNKVNNDLTSVNNVVTETNENIKENEDCNINDNMKNENKIEELKSSKITDSVFNNTK